MRYCVVMAVSLLALVGWGQQALAAGERPSRPPRTLWNAFPLDPQRSAADRAALERVSSRRPLRASEEKSWVVILVLGTLVAVGATFTFRPQLASTLTVSIQRRLWRLRLYLTESR
jgi:hypothetical protein